ncbi:hypothetical protein ESZ53_12430 [Salinibacterium sp. UTAS2018]|uniref:hypothetical protein n=1 Tax=Salinibacterium sp. UTAS2018 TaxID=2508880 RepID=UPI001009816F|nr:hypothetical protein [Salinibacterium sp. UTAS2018]QAV71174.1 hypothetical protein ESZ53_12430 [Salinibacterium sp. UTAS2018]
MAIAAAPLPERGDGLFALDFVPPSHHGLRLVRVFLPVLDRELLPVRWSKFVDFDLTPASLSWWELLEQAGQEFPEVHTLASCGGELDEATADALRDAIGDTQLHSLRWDGYWENPASASPVYVHEHEYSLAPLRRSELAPGMRVPEFVWDDAATFAWGSRLYPDSLIVACDPDRFAQFHADPRLDVITVRPERDSLPASFGD